jgi:hypothetical protein
MWHGQTLVKLLRGGPTPTTRQASGEDRHLNFNGDRYSLWTSTISTGIRLIGKRKEEHEYRAAVGEASAGDGA